MLNTCIHMLIECPNKNNTGCTPVIHTLCWNDSTDAILTQHFRTTYTLGDPCVPRVEFRDIQLTRSNFNIYYVFPISKWRWTWSLNFQICTMHSSILVAVVALKVKDFMCNHQAFCCNVQACSKLNLPRHFLIQQAAAYRIHNPSSSRDYEQRESNLQSEILGCRHWSIVGHDKVNGYSTLAQ